VLQIAENILRSAARGRDEAVSEVMSRLQAMTRNVLEAGARANGPRLTKLEHVMDMSKAAMSSTIAFTDGVDLESINKSK
jgi:ATP-binding cassette, subfamily F, member 3